MEQSALTVAQTENLQIMLQSHDLSNCLLALHLTEQQASLSPSLLSTILGVYTYYNANREVSKLAKKILNKKGKKAVVKFLRATPKKGFEDWTVYQWQEYTNELEEQTHLPTLPLVALWYALRPEDPKHLKLYTAAVAKLPAQERQGKS